MDFAFDGTATAVADAADEVFTRHRPEWADRFGDGPGFDAELWRAMGAAGLTALPLPAIHAGDDLDALAILPLLRRMGESAAVTPALGTLASALTLAHADPDTPPDGARARWTATLTDGGWHAVALGEPGDALAATPRTTIRNGRLTGTKTGVLHADGAAALIVSTDSGVVLVRPDAPGITLTRTPASTGWSEYTVRFDDVPVDDADILAGSGAAGPDAGARPGNANDTSDFLRDVYRLMLAGYADGLVAGATALTADHVTGRTQFGKPIALFQAVTQQLADVYVIGRALNLATTSAAWRLAEGRDAGEDLGVAVYWVADEIPATLRTMTHLHGGVGVDLSYPLPRYFSIAKDLARLAGGSLARLDELAGIGDAEPAGTDVADAQTADTEAASTDAAGTQAGSAAATQEHRTATATARPEVSAGVR